MQQPGERAKKSNTCRPRGESKHLKDLKDLKNFAWANFAWANFTLANFGKPNFGKPNFGKPNFGKPNFLLAFASPSLYPRAKS